MKKSVLKAFAFGMLAMTGTKSFAQLYSQTNVVVNLSGSTPATSWVSSGTPLFVGYGQATPGNSDFNVVMASATANARGVLGLKRSRGTLAAPSAVATNDQLGSLLISGFDGSNFQGSAAVDFFADGTPTAGAVPARISFVTGTNSGNRTERLKIGSGGDITVNANQFFVQKSTGRVGLGTLTPGGQLELSLDQARKPSTSTWTITSDARLKDIDGAYTKGLEDILKLQPITYHYKNVGERKFDAVTLATPAVGFSAQDVQKVFPEAVGTDADGYLNLNIHPILIASINAIKELKGQTAAKDNTIAEQQGKLDKLQAQVDKQEQQATAQQAQINMLLQKLGELQKAQPCNVIADSKSESKDKTASVALPTQNDTKSLVVIK